MLQTIPHLVRVCHHDFAERILIVDTAPLHPRYAKQPGIASLADLRDCCQTLVQRGFIDNAVDIDYAPATVRAITTKHLGAHIRHPHNFRGYPVLGLPFSIERAIGDCFLHFDSDMLLHQDLDYDWVQRAMELLIANPDILTVSPLSGPPHPEGVLMQGAVTYSRDSRGFYAFKTFTSRKFILHRRRFESVLPIKPVYLSWKRQLLSYLTGRSPVFSWESAVSQFLMLSNYIRADLDDPRAWTLHTPDHGPTFLRKLPSIIRRVEHGDPPPAQAGLYDLMLDAW